MNFKFFDVFLALSTENIQTLTDFYSQLLQREPDVFRPTVYAEFQLEKLRIAIFKPKLERKQEFENFGSGMSLCLEVEDINLAISNLIDMGFPPPGEIIEASHGKEIYAYDPEGNRLIIHQPKTLKN